MIWIRTAFSKHWRNFHFASIVLLCSVMISGVGGIPKVVGQIAFTGFYYPFFLLRSSIEELHDVALRNHELQVSLVEASVKISQYEEVVRENERLRTVLGFAAIAEFDLLPAKVISVEGARIPILATINKGMNDSVFAPQTVTNQEGLIGRVVSSTAGFAIVRLLTHPTNRVAVRVANSRHMGIVRYTAAEGMILDNLPVQSKIGIGDTIISSGLGGIYPPGLRVGIVIEVVLPEDEPFCEVKLQPAARFDAIEELFVLKQQQP